MKVVRFTSPMNSAHSPPRVDGENFRDLSAAEQALLNCEAVLPRKPEPVWIRLRNAFCAPLPRKLVPKTPPPSPRLPPQAPFNPYHTLRVHLVEAANKCVASMVEDHERQARYARTGIHTNVRDLDVVAGPLFITSRLGPMYVTDAPGGTDGFVEAHAFHELDVAEPYQIDDNLVWGPSQGYLDLCEAVDRLRRWCGKNGLENLRVGLDCIDVGPRVQGEHRYIVSGLWLKADAPDIRASFQAPVNP